MKLLHIDSSLFGHDSSVSRQLSAQIVAHLQLTLPDVEVTYRDIGDAPPPHLTVDLLESLDERPEENAMARRILDEFLDTQIVVIGAPMYNFSIPSSLKAWLDHVLKAGVTFRYTETGSVGLAGDKHVVVASSRGGIYSTGALASMDQQETLLKSAFGLMGVDSLLIVRAEGLAMGAERHQFAMDAAVRAIGELDLTQAAV